MEWLGWFEAPNYEWARQVLQRGVAALFFVAFLSTLNQFRALLGEHGLLPAPALLEAERQRGPTIFRWWGYSDRKLVAVCVVGLVVSALLVLGLLQFGPAWLPLAAFLVLYGLYMSIVNIGQTFYGFGWEMLLLEAGFTVGLLGSNQVAPMWPVLVLIAWLVFRVEFGAGMIKLRGDPAWKDLTAMNYHHETQPMPNPVSRTAHLKPLWWHRAETLGNHGVQLVVPFLLFLPQPVASTGAALIIITQLWLVVTGNYAWLNWITIVLAFCAVDDRVLSWLVPALPADLGTTAPVPWWWAIVVGAGCLAIVVASIPALQNLFSARQLMNASFNRWQLGNAYGAFGSVTRTRVEIIIEGGQRRQETAKDDDGGWGDDGAVDWRAYEFKGKPGDVTRRPRQYAPYHLRLDWMMWFLPLGSVHQRWFYALLEKLLEADPATLRLLRHDPFDGRRPAMLRVRAFRYRFATRTERREQRVYWVRDRPRTLIGPLAVHD